MSKELDKALIAKAEEIAKNGTTMEATQFLNGADFYRKNIWHDASEEPLEQRELLCEWESIDATWHDVGFYHKFDGTFWNYSTQITPVTRWAYIDDLITKNNE